ncbi:uncharacterized protein LOC109797869 [Cajanus cajan]|uniref:Uncharacterized protein n=1 Tax=Cajanus cajan TaxID=3821 RepID=A0A151TRL7_CAJCA|nr:uncharacterized protein LOC109797869 [Cajanus cajan]KYP69671.1 hypothetical protein KK1_008871 [Cajanus cajan]
MGKKKPQQTKELSVAIAEASSTIDEKGQEEQQEPQEEALAQAHAPRKRGRPRKLIAKMEREEEKEQGGIEISMEKGTTKEVEVASSTCMRVEEMQLPKVEPSRSRARRKSKPRKSS